MILRRGLALTALLLAGCSSTPILGPSMLVLPGTGKNFDQFRFDEQDCRSYAQNQLGKGAESDSAGTPQQRYDRSFVQCMYAKGHRVPIGGRVGDYIDSTQSPVRTASPAPPLATPPPPPPPPSGQPPAEAPPDFRKN
jgi:hypothetical protein